MAWCLAYDNLAYGDTDAFEISCQDGLFFFFFFLKIIVAQMTNVDFRIVFWTSIKAIDKEVWGDRFNYVKL